MYDVAAAAAFTFLLANPQHEVMKSNVAYYQKMPEIKTTDFKNLEAKKHQVREKCYFDVIQDIVESFNNYIIVYFCKAG